MPDYSTPKSRWTALLTRDPLAADAFVYCVTTTKIYCRPNCPSRLARQANIEYHDTAANARAAGFRACKRCRPEISEGEGDPQKIAIAKTCTAIKEEAEGRQKKTIKELAKDVGFTESHFCRIFKKGIGMTVSEYRMSISRMPDPVSETLLSETQAHSEVESPKKLELAVEFNNNTLLSQDGQGQPEFDFGLTNEWDDFSSILDTYDSWSCPLILHIQTSVAMNIQI
jgi:methylphosphotriester-DNA--protein-cysteine methyltransferase